MRKLLVLTFVISSITAFSQTKTPSDAELFQTYLKYEAINKQKREALIQSQKQPYQTVNAPVNNIIINNNGTQEETLTPEESKRKFKVQMIAAGVGAAVMGVVGLVMLMGM